MNAWWAAALAGAVCGLLSGLGVGGGALRYSCYVGAADRAVGVEDYETKAGMSRLYNYVNFDKFRGLPGTGTNGEPCVAQLIDARLLLGQ